MRPGSEAKAVGDIVRQFIAYSLEHGGTQITAEAMRVARVLAGQDPTRLVARLLDQIPQLVEAAEEPVEVIQHALAGGALIARHLLDQCAADVDRAQSLIFLFAQDWTRLFTGLPMKRQWVERPSTHSLFEDGPV
jgi:hypothetical protein